MNKLKKKAVIILSIIALLLILLFSIRPLIANAGISVGDRSHLYGEKELAGLLQLKGTNALKLVVKVYYIDPDTNKKLAAFCINPEKPGVGTGASDFGGYDSYITEKFKDAKYWRALYRRICRKKLEGNNCGK